MVEEQHQLFNFVHAVFERTLNFFRKSHKVSRKNT